MMRKIGSMKQLSMDIQLNEMRRRARAARNEQLRRRLADDRETERAFERLISLWAIGEGKPEKTPNFA